jgi:hypothetical protein
MMMMTTMTMMMMMTITPSPRMPKTTTMTTTITPSPRMPTMTTMATLRRKIHLPAPPRRRPASSPPPRSPVPSFFTFIRSYVVSPCKKRSLSSTYSNAMLARSRRRRRTLLAFTLHSVLENSPRRQRLRARGVSSNRRFLRAELLPHRGVGLIRLRETRVPTSTAAGRGGRFQVN